jgi:hypothetical protein
MSFSYRDHCSKAYIVVVEHNHGNVTRAYGISKHFCLGLRCRIGSDTDNPAWSATGATLAQCTGSELPGGDRSYKSCRRSQKDEPWGWARSSHWSRRSTNLFLMELTLAGSHRERSRTSRGSSRRSKSWVSPPAYYQLVMTVGEAADAGMIGQVELISGFAWCSSEPGFQTEPFNRWRHRDVREAHTGWERCRADRRRKTVGSLRHGQRIKRAPGRRRRGAHLPAAVLPN